MTYTIERKERCFEPIGSLLIRNLIVPHIYYQESLLGQCIDVIAIDRAGTSDFHAVCVYDNLKQALDKGISNMLSIPAHYRWVAFQGEGIYPKETIQQNLLELQQNQKILFPESGMGRVGVIEIVRMYHNDLGANVRIKAERFKLNADTLQRIDQFVKATEPDKKL